MAELLEILKDELDEETILELSQIVGGQEGATQQAVSMLVPVLIAGLARNVQEPAGSAALDSALRRDHDGSLLGKLGSLFGSSSQSGGLGALLGGLLGGAPAREAATPEGAVNARQVDGAGILQHVLGEQQGAVAESVARNSGLDGNQVSRLMQLLAPVVLAALGRVKHDHQLGPQGVTDLIRRESRTIEEEAPQAGLQGRLAGWLDSNQDGKVDFQDNIAKVGAALGTALLIGVGRRRKR